MRHNRYDSSSVCRWTAKEYTKLTGLTVPGLPVSTNKVATLIVIGIKPITMITRDIANSVFLKCLTVLSVMGYLNSDSCFTITFTIKNIAMALMPSNINMYGINSIIYGYPLSLADHQPLDIF